MNLPANSVASWDMVFVTNGDVVGDVVGVVSDRNRPWIGTSWSSNDNRTNMERSLFIVILRKNTISYDRLKNLAQNMDEQ